MTDLARKTVSGVLLTLMQNIGTRTVTFLAQLVLARLLLPEEFGLIGLAFTVNALVQPLLDFGIEDVLMSRRKSLALWLGPAYGLSITLAFLSACLLGLAGFAAARLYNSPQLIGLTANLALGAALYGFSVVPDAKLRSDLRFDVTSTYALAETVVVQTVTLLLAWAGCGAYSFVLPIPVASAVRAALFFRLAPIDMRGSFRLSRWRRLLANGALVFGQRLLQTMREQGDFYVLGLMTNPTTVGFYYLSYRLAAQPVYVLVRSLGAIIFPVLTNIRDDPERQIAVVLNASRVVALLVTPASFLLAAVADPLIPLLFGARWAPAVPYVQVLSIGLAFDVRPAMAYALATSRGLFRLQLVLGAGATLLFMICITAGFAGVGPLGVAGGVTFYFMIISAVYPAVLFRPLPRKLAVLMRLWIEPTALAGIAFGAGAAAATTLSPEWLVERIVVTALTGTAVYVALASLCLRGFLREVGVHLGEVVPAKFRGRQPA